MKQKLNLEVLSDIYLVSNTSTFLYNKFSKDESVISLTRSYSQDVLIYELENLAKIEISKIEDLVFAYSLYIAILLFDNDRTLEFLHSSAGKISFEWFPQLRSLYLARYKSYNFEKISIKPGLLKAANTKNSSHIESNKQEFSFL